MVPVRGYLSSKEETIHEGPNTCWSILDGDESSSRDAIHRAECEQAGTELVEVHVSNVNLSRCNLLPWMGAK